MKNILAKTENFPLKGRDTHRELPSANSLFRCSQRPALGQTKARGLELNLAFWHREEWPNTQSNQLLPPRKCIKGRTGTWTQEGCNCPLLCQIPTTTTLHFYYYLRGSQSPPICWLPPQMLTTDWARLHGRSPFNRPSNSYLSGSTLAESWSWDTAPRYSSNVGSNILTNVFTSQPNIHPYRKHFNESRMHAFLSLA